MKKSILFILLFVVCNVFANDKIYQAYLNAKQYEDFSSEMNFDVKDKVTLKQFNKWLDTNGEYVQINLNSQNNISIGEAVGNTLASLLFDTSTANIEIIKNNDLINIQYKRIFMYGCSHDFVLKVNFIKKSNVKRYFNYIQQQIELQKQRNYENSLKEAIMFGIGVKLFWEGTKWVAKKAYDNGLLSFDDSDSDSSQSSNSNDSNSSINSSQTKEVLFKIIRKNACAYDCSESYEYIIYVNNEKHSTRTLGKRLNGEWKTDCPGSVMGTTYICDGGDFFNAAKKHYEQYIGDKNNNYKIEY